MRHFANGSFVKSGTSNLAVRELTHRYDGKAAVDHVSFDVAAGEIAALLGQADSQPPAAP